MPRKILIVRLSALGDVIQSLPLISMLKAGIPGVKLGWLVEKEIAPLLYNHPDLDYCHIAEKNTWLKQLTNPFTRLPVFHEIDSIGYDLVLDAQSLLKSAITTWLTKIPIRYGITGAREGARFFYTHPIALSKRQYFDPLTPMVRHYQTMASVLGGVPTAISYPMANPNQSIKSHINTLLQVLPQGEPLVVMAPATQWVNKHWPKSYWTQLMANLLSQTSVNIVIVGTPNDVRKHQTLYGGLHTENRVLDLTGQTPLPLLQALLQQTHVLIGSDSAPLHLAGALGHAQVIGLYGPTESHRTPPPGSRNQLLSLDPVLPCQPCHKRRCRYKTTQCMVDLLPQRVIDAVFSALQLARLNHAIVLG